MNPKVGDLITLKPEYRDPEEEQGIMLILGQEDGTADMSEEKKITQHLIDNAFSCLDGYGRLTYALDDCKIIQRVLKEEHNVFLSISECQRFWKWRSNLWDASFLTVQDNDSSRKEILDFFQEWLDEMDIWEWAQG